MALKSPMSYQAVAINKISIVENHFALSVTFRVLVEMLNSTSVEGATSSNDSVHFIALLDEKLY
jgi:hypothetical protein